MLTETIKASTLAYHQQTEKILTGKLKNMRSVDDYIQILKLFYSYFGGLEQQADKYVSTEILRDYKERRKTTALASDLNILGSGLPTYADGTDLPQINDHLQALGALYVMEGSTLGGKIVGNMVQQHLRLNDNQGTAFFSGYGEQTAQKWADFKTVLNSIATSAEDEQTIINAANETFEKFRCWMQPFQQPVY